MTSYGTTNAAANTVLNRASDEYMRSQYNNSNTNKNYGSTPPPNGATPPNMNRNPGGPANYSGTPPPLANNNMPPQNYNPNNNNYSPERRPQLNESNSKNYNNNSNINSLNNMNNSQKPAPNHVNDNAKYNHDPQINNQHYDDYYDQHRQKNLSLEYGKTIKLLRNGDEYYRGQKYVINSRKYRYFDVFLDDISDSMNARFGAVRSIHTPINGHRVTNLDELEDGKTYVASGTGRFVKLKYAHMAPQPSVGFKRLP